MEDSKQVNECNQRGPAQGNFLENGNNKARMSTSRANQTGFYQIQFSTTLCGCMINADPGSKWYCTYCGD